ncbi:ead/Ea22-like family protein [Enterobacter sp. E12]|uniref:ead/Ea22-like family protein n=1 Tax=Enterobacter sp. E12 TaxID=2769348 RepID=UPI0016616D28|nr:ead/Ea22-like family protein [Enterobacter sp. E12]MBD0815579.1 ead/Ea22-like family protein [Enterobacter sp. E12]
MSNIDKRALRDSAESTIGILESIAGFEPSDIDGDTVELRFETEDGFDTGCDVSIVDQCKKAADVIRALLDELEAAENRTAEVESQRRMAFMACNRWEDKFREAEKRIAELERNEIREEGNQFLVVRHPGKIPVVKHCAGELEGFLRQLLEHDPMATIDIITHRYYGVGGQWVQDADEYLQMMAAAAGKGE